jgi:hypothetical protein
VALPVSPTRPIRGRMSGQGVPRGAAIAGVGWRVKDGRYDNR